MDTHPAVRRRTRSPRRENPSAPVRQMPPQSLLLVITDDPSFVNPPVDDSRAVSHWVVRNGKGNHGADFFAGDPTNPTTYEFAADRTDVAAIVALSDPARNAATVAAIQESNAEISVLWVGEATPAEIGPLTQVVDWRAVVCANLEDELFRLETRKRVRALRAFAEGAAMVPILIHQDPDPDALASALAIRSILRRTPEESPVITLDEITRPENRRMADLLDLQVTQVTSDELAGFDHIICADMQPRDQFDGDGISLAVIDHHPEEAGYNAEFFDIRPNYGATATILTEYLRADDERRLGDRLATAMVYAIKTDTDGLSRGVHPADVEAYAFLLERCDATLLRLIERPSLSADTARSLGHALASLVLDGELAVTYLGGLDADQSHILSDVADTALAIEEATWAAAGALVEGRLVITLRHLGGAPGAGDLARRLAAKGGSGGGHATMARAVLPLKDEWAALKDAPLETGRDLLLERMKAELERLR